MFFGNPTPHAAAKGYTQVLTGRLTAARNYDVVGDLLVIRIFFFIRFLRSSTRVRPPPVFPPRHGKSPHIPRNTTPDGLEILKNLNRAEIVVNPSFCTRRCTRFINTWRDTAVVTVLCRSKITSLKFKTEKRNPRSTIFFHIPNRYLTTEPITQLTSLANVDASRICPRLYPFIV